MINEINDGDDGDTDDEYHIRGFIACQNGPLIAARMVQIRHQIPTYSNLQMFIFISDVENEKIMISLVRITIRSLY